MFGVRASAGRVHGSDAPDSTYGFSFSGSSSQFSGAAPFTAHASTFFVLGGGSGGFEGALGGKLTAGVRAPVGADHGPFIRIGLGGEMLGNDELYFSRFELPLGEIGWQYRHGRTVLEAGARGAPVLAGKYNTGGATHRNLNSSWEWGGYLSVQTWFMRLDFDATRIEHRSGTPGTAVDMMRFLACTYPWGHVGACVDLSYWNGQGVFANVVTRSRTVYGGVMIGIAAW